MLLLENHVPLKTLLNPKEQQDRESRVEGLGALSHPLRATCKAEHRQPVHRSVADLKGQHGFLGCNPKGPGLCPWDVSLGEAAKGQRGIPQGQKSESASPKWGPG